MQIGVSSLILLSPGPKGAGTSRCTEGAHKPGTLSTLDEQCAYQLGPQSLPGLFHGSHRDLVVLCVLFTHQASDMNTVSHTHTHTHTQLLSLPRVMRINGAGEGVKPCSIQHSLWARVTVVD
jgi:hypothetical protein